MAGWRPDGDGEALLPGEPSPDRRKVSSSCLIASTSVVVLTIRYLHLLPSGVEGSCKSCAAGGPDVFLHCPPQHHSDQPLLGQGGQPEFLNHD